MKRALVVAILGLSACGRDSSGNAERRSAADRTPAETERAGPPMQPPPATPSRPVCFLSDEPPTATAHYLAANAQTDAGAFGAGIDGRVVRVDLAWDGPYEHMDLAVEHSMAEPPADASTELEHWVDMSGSDRRGYLLVAVPSGASLAQIDGSVTCTPHGDWTNVHISLGLKQDTIDVEVRVDNGY